MLLRRARHIVTENARVLEVVAILRGDADPRAIGPMLTAGPRLAARRLRDLDARSSTPCVEAALDAGAHGARMVGGGFGGSAIALVDVDAPSDGRRRGHRGGSRARGTSRRARSSRVPSAGARRLA